MLFEQGRGHDQLTVQVPDDAAREDVDAAEGIQIADGMDRIAHPEHGHLLAGHERTGAAVRIEVIPRGHSHPCCGTHSVTSAASRSVRVTGLGCPRSSTNTTRSSASSLLMK